MPDKATVSDGFANDNIGGAPAEVPQATEPAAAPERVRWFGWLWRAISLLSLLNVVGHGQALVQFSGSIHKLVAWWNYLTVKLFSLLQIHLPVLERHMIILFLVAFSAANIGHYKAHGRTLARDYLGLLSNDRDAWLRVLPGLARKERIGSDITATLVFAIVTGTLIYMAAAYFTYFGGKIVAAYLIALPVAVAVSALTVKSSGLVKKIAKWVFILIVAPYALMLFLVLAISGYRKEIAVTVGLVVAVLLLDQLFQAVVDPLSGILTNLPEPPA